MTREHLQQWAQMFGQQLARILPGGIKFTLVLATNADGVAPAEGATKVHTATGGTMNGREMHLVLSNLLHGIEIDPDEIQLGATVDRTPPPGGGS